jgi:hypothetical protein
MRPTGKMRPALADLEPLVFLADFFVADLRDGVAIVVLEVVELRREQRNTQMRNATRHVRHDS